MGKKRRGESGKKNILTHKGDDDVFRFLVCLAVDAGVDGVDAFLFVFFPFFFFCASDTKNFVVGEKLGENKREWRAPFMPFSWRLWSMDFSLQWTGFQNCSKVHVSDVIVKNCFFLSFFLLLKFPHLLADTGGMLSEEENKECMRISKQLKIGVADVFITSKVSLPALNFIFRGFWKMNGN